jgi:hypothetical protein
MYHDIISIGLIGGMFYITMVTIAKAENVKSYINLNGFFKLIFGFLFYKGNRFSTKSIVGQTLNLVAILVSIIAYLSGFNDTLGLFITLEVINVFIGIVLSLFVNL